MSNDSASAKLTNPYSASNPPLIGVVFILVPLICLPSYLRIIYVFATRRKYHRNECFQIMIHIGFSQFLMAPGFVLAGVKVLTESDVYGISLFGIMVVWCSLKLKAVLSLVLALNRLKVIVGLLYPPKIHTALILCGYLVFVINMVVLLSPWSSLAYQTNSILPKFDKSLPYSNIVRWSGFGMVVLCALLTVCIYVVIIGQLTYRRQQTEFVAVKSNETKILVQAVLQFTCDLFIAIWFHFWKHLFTEDVWSEFCRMSLLALNQLLVPQMLYLWLIRSLRRYLWPCSMYKQVRGSSAWTKEQYSSFPPTV